MLIADLSYEAELYCQRILTGLHSHALYIGTAIPISKVRPFFDLASLSSYVCADS